MKSSSKHSPHSNSSYDSSSLEDSSLKSHAPDAQDLFVQEYSFTVEKTGETTPIQYFCNRSLEPVYFPDRTLAALFQVNLSTLRGRLNRMTKRHEGYRLLISEKSKTRLSALHFVNWGAETYAAEGSQSPSPLHGLVAVNHLILANYALSEWIAYNHERLGTSLGEIERNLAKVNLAFTRANNVITILSKRTLSPSHPLLLPRPQPPTDDACSSTTSSPASSPSSSPQRPRPNSLRTSPIQVHQLASRKRSRADSWEYYTPPSQRASEDSTPISPSQSPHSSPHSWDIPQFNPSKLMRPEPPSMGTLSDEDSGSDNGSPHSSPNRWHTDNTIQCIIEGENVCHRLDLACLGGFGVLRAALSALFCVNSFHILYQTILDSGYQELTVKDNSDEEKWLQFLAIVKKICVRPFSVTPQLKNLLS